MIFTCGNGRLASRSAQPQWWKKYAERDSARRSRTEKSTRKIRLIGMSMKRTTPFAELSGRAANSTRFTSERIDRAPMKIS